MVRGEGMGGRVLRALEAAGASTAVGLQPSLRCSGRVLKISYLHPPHCCAGAAPEELVSAPCSGPSHHAAQARSGVGHVN